MTLDESVIKAYYQKYHNLNIDDNQIKCTEAYKCLYFYSDLKFKNKVNYVYYYLSNSEIKSLWNCLSIEKEYNSLVLKSLNALLAYYKNKYSLTYDKNKDIITKLIINDDILKLLKKDINKIDKISLFISSIHDSYSEISEIYSAFKDIILIEENEYNRIDQNNCSIKLPFKQLFYPDSRTNFYLTFFNFFQNLDNNLKYESYSQSATTYHLKQLEKLNKIKIHCITKDLKINLNKYYESFHNVNNKDIQMYNVIFEKIDSFHLEDLDYVFNIFHNLKINNKYLNYYLKNNNIYFKINNLSKIKLLTSKDFDDFKFTLALVLEILLNMKDDFNEVFIQNKKAKYVDASLQRQMHIYNEKLK